MLLCANEESTKALTLLASGTENGSDIALILAIQMPGFLIKQSDLYHKSRKPTSQFPSLHIAVLNEASNPQLFLLTSTGKSRS